MEISRICLDTGEIAKTWKKADIIQTLENRQYKNVRKSSAAANVINE